MKKSYEKVILGVAVFVAVAMIALGMKKLGGVEEDFPDAREKMGKAPSIGTESLVNYAARTISEPVALQTVQTSEGREISSFVSEKLFVKKGEEGAIDIEAPGSPSIHSGIPNDWWFKHGMESEIGFGDAPQRDFDKDGFSNLEEFKEKTDPSDKNRFPSLFDKLRLADIGKDDWYLRFSSFGAGALSFKIEGIIDGKKAENKMRGGKAITPGMAFFAEGAYKERFKFVELGKIEGRGGIQKDLAKIEDLKEGKGNQIYEVPSGANRIIRSDYTARLFLDTPDQRDSKFEVEEGMSFSLPYDSEAKEKPYTFKGIGPNGDTALLLWDNDGKTTEVELSVKN